MSMVLYDSRDPHCKSLFGAIPTDEVVTFRVFLPILYQLRDPCLMIYKADRWDSPERIPMAYESSDGVRTSHACIFYAPDPQLYFYRFEVQGVNGPLQIARDQDGFGVLTPQDGAMWQLTVYDRALSTPSFLHQGIYYQIFPDRFYASGAPKEGVPPDRRMHGDWYELPNYRPDRDGQYTNSDYFGGDLEGIRQKLPYLKELGVGILYLNPIFEAHSNHRYNTADYLKVDPLLGSEEDLRRLCQEAGELGIRVLLDGVFNHTGADSVYFNKFGRYGARTGAYNDPESPCRSWYQFTHYPDKYESWWGFLELPSLNEADPGYAQFICGPQGVLRHWLDCGISGWRLDVADELPDSFLDRLCASVRAYRPDAAIIGAVWEDASNKVSYGQRRRYLLGGQLDSVMNYPFRTAILNYVRYGDCSGFYNTVMGILENYPRPVWAGLMNCLSTHDVERAITALAGEPTGQNDREWQGHNNTLSPQRYDLGKRLLKLAAVLQYTLPGTPCLYYGDEAGLYGYKDPFNRSCYPWGREDGELLAFFRQLGRLRASFPELADGAFCVTRCTPQVAAYTRDCGAYSFFVAVNRTGEPQPVPVPADFEGARRLLGGLEAGALPAYGALVLSTH